MSSNGWRTAAIVFMVLFIVETLAFAGLWYVGSSEIAKQDDCSYTCYEKDYDSFALNDKVCSCYLNGEVAYTERIK
jgi:hypothetical protein